MSSEFTGIKDSLVDKILEQGQRLRNAMVQSILQNDPFTGDIYSKTHNTPVSSATSLTCNSNGKKLLEAFLNGDYLTKEQEQMALNTARSVPMEEVCNTIGKSNFSKCACAVCSAYHPTNLKCDLRRPQTQLKQLKGGVPADALKQVDSLKIILQSVHLNNAGSKKVSFGKGRADSRLNETYFLEYSVPEVFSKGVVRSKSKTDSGLESSVVRVCARRTSNVIHVRQAFIHSICNLYNCNLEDHDISFVVRFKSSSKKKAEQLGVAKFNFGAFTHSPTASCGKTLPIFLSEDSTISVGTLKVTLQLGAGKLYFGQEFLDAVLNKDSPLESSSSEEIATIAPNTWEERLVCKEKPSSVNKSVEKPHSAALPQISPIFQCSKTTEKLQSCPLVDKAVQLEAEPTEVELLFGFLYISEANFLNISPNSFMLCKPYCQNETSSSRIVYASASPLYNFCQTIPLLYEESLLLNLRENFMLIEFWEKTAGTEELLGLTRLPLHQFYLGFRNSIILKHLKRNKLPVIGTDWWEPIYSASQNELIGQVQVLTALGTEAQIKNLELERGFREEIVKAKFPKAAQLKPAFKQPESYFSDRAKVNRKTLENFKNSPSTARSEHTKKPEVVDVGVQSDMEKLNQKTQAQPDVKEAREMLLAAMNLIEQTKKPSCVENSTNTENGISKGDSSEFQKVEKERPKMATLSKTAPLLNSLATELGLSKSKPTKAPHFLAEICITAANLQLPSRRKSKAKSKRARDKIRQQEQENLLRSTYVTFETLPGEPLQMTGLWPKCPTPLWDFTSRVRLPMDLVADDKKRLIFKVWEKATNTVLQPNMKTDTVLGFAALDLSIIGMGMPNVQGWFNIMDFSDNCKGQIHIKVNPLDDLQKLLNPMVQVTSNVKSETATCPKSGDPNGLGRTLKRKFAELDGITQRLRLSEVVSDESEDPDTDKAADEFEHDINNLCVEEDFEMANFDDTDNHTAAAESNPGPSGQNDSAELGVYSAEQQSSYSSLLSENKFLSSTDPTRRWEVPENVLKGKVELGIDNLLEKLNLLTSGASQSFAQRYVSGCSAPSDPSDIQGIFKDLEQHSRPNITNSFDPTMFQRPCSGSLRNSSLLQPVQFNNADEANDGSATSVISDFSDCRSKPDGQDPPIG
ncbi:hypothetical protein HUJ05_000163 [Dendroctonus ponderosae]|nr:hypothetical protein HUJ05_000163 [Dendroctonus ponderosae]